jgi:hypothetical protein
MKLVCVSDQGMNSVEDLYSSHEGADTRMVVHAMTADADLVSGGVQGSITIKSPDTDVIFLAVHYFPQIKHTHTHTHTHIQDRNGKCYCHFQSSSVYTCSRNMQSLSPEIPRLLPVCHSLTGCDTVSSLLGIGKRRIRVLFHNWI